MRHPIIINSHGKTERHQEFWMNGGYSVIVGGCNNVAIGNYSIAIGAGSTSIGYMTIAGGK